MTNKKNGTAGMDVRGKRVLVLGIGASGTAAAALLLRKGAQVSCSDSGDSEEAVKRARRIEEMGGRVELGGHTERFAEGVEMAVISPGIDPSMPFVRGLAHRGVPVFSEIELAYRFCTSPIVAVTGTNGKTTTVTLLEHALVRGGKQALACGNIGTPLSDVVGTEREPEIIVCEVSSFQLEGVSRFRPWIAVALNVADDHLERYRDIDDYRNAKAAIFRNQKAGDWAIVNARERADWERASVLGNQSVLEFSSDGEVDEGACLLDGSLVVRLKGKTVEICRRGELRLTGDHNVENTLAVAAAAMLCGVGPEAVREELKTFKGLPHRMEQVMSCNGVKFINDSKATNPDAVVRALRAVDGPIILIAGGKDKGFDYSVLGGEVSKRVKAAVLIGEASAKIEHDLGGVVETHCTESMSEAVRTAVKCAIPGDTVMLSPACSSYDMYNNYEERGDDFRKCVREIMINPK